MRKFKLLLGILACTLLVGCNSNTTMKFKIDNCEITVSTPHEAVVIEEANKMQSAEGYTVKILDGASIREVIQECYMKYSLDKGMTDTGDTTFTTTITSDGRQELSFIRCLGNSDLGLVVVATGTVDTPVDTSDFLSFYNSLDIEVKGEYLNYDWVAFTETVTDKQVTVGERDYSQQGINNAVDIMLKDNPDAAKEVLGKDTAETQEDYNKLFESAVKTVEEDKKPPETADTTTEDVDIAICTEEDFIPLFYVGCSRPYLYETLKRYKTDNGYLLNVEAITNYTGSLDDIVQATLQKSADAKFKNITEYNNACVLLGSKGFKLYYQYKDLVIEYTVAAQENKEPSTDEMQDILGYLLFITKNNMYTSDPELAEEYELPSSSANKEPDSTEITLVDYTANSSESTEGSEDDILNLPVPTDSSEEPATVTE